MNRVIGRYSGEEKGPLLIIFGGMHGNEPAGVKALEAMFEMLEVEPTTNPDFKFAGRLIGLIGNKKAYMQKKRFIERDLNRLWEPDRIARIKKVDATTLAPEEQELLELTTIIEQELQEYQPDKLIILDLHTTSSFGGIFTIVTDEEESLRIGVELHAPVITGMLTGIRGTTLHYFNTENMGVSTVAVTFESGQHDEPLSVSRAIAAITNCMRTIGCVNREHIENKHDKILIEYSSDLPKVSQLIMAHAIEPEDKFQMKPGYKNFQSVNKGEVIALDKDGQIQVDQDGRLLMPLYQKQGEDGFFLIKEMQGY